MDMLEHFDIFKSNVNSSRLADLEEKIIDSLFEKYIPQSGRVLVVSAYDIPYIPRLAKKGYSVTVTETNEDRIAALTSDPEAAAMLSIVRTTPFNLSMLESGSFDIVITLGVMCRLQTKAEREEFTREVLRVLTEEGHLAYTYMTPLAMTIGQYYSTYKSLDVQSKLRSFRRLAAVEKTHAFDKFYGLTLDEMTDIAREYNINILTVAATYPMINDFTGEIEALSAEEYGKFVADQISICEDPFITRYSMRGIFIGKKKPIDLFG